jgi:YcxB-like protein
MGKVVYKLTWQDFKALERYIRSKKFNARLTFCVQYIVVPLSLLGLPLWSAFKFKDFDNLWRWAPSGFLVPWIAAMAFQRWLLHKKLKKAGILDQDSAFGISEAGLWRKDHTGEGTTFWSAIQEILDYPDHIFFVMSIGDGIHVIPKRSFLTFEEASAFHQKALCLWEKRRNG